MYRDFARAEASCSSIEQIQHHRIRRRCRPTRRDFLKIGAAVAATGALGRPSKVFAATPPRIVIVGAGIAGLNAALTLQDAGYATTIYEASSRIGGRMHSDTTSWGNGQVTEHCGELIDTRHKTIIGLAKRFGIQVVDLLAAEPNQSTETYYFSGQYYTRADANDDFNAVYHAVKKDLNAADFPTLYNSFTPAGAALDQTTVFDWIESRVPGGHGSRMGQLLDVAYNIEYGAETTDQSALNLIYLLAYQPVPGNFRIFGRSDERYHMAGGNEQLPSAIASALQPGSVQLGTAMTGIAQNGDGSFSLGFQSGQNAFTVVADRVILTLPFSVLRNLDYAGAGFNDVKVTGIQQLGYGTNAKLHLQFQTRLWNQPGPWGLSTGSTYADTGYQNTWEVTRAQPGSTGILVDYTGGNVGASFTDDPSLVQAYAMQFLQQLEPVFPNITQQWNGKATLDTPFLNPFFRGSYSYWRRGQYTLFSGSERERSGRCHFAGEHCSINFQGFMEGAAQEGARAANEILSDYKGGIFRWNRSDGPDGREVGLPAVRRMLTQLKGRLQEIEELHDLHRQRRPSQVRADTDRGPRVSLRRKRSSTSA
jgi:monoamine oxidase